MTQEEAVQIAAVDGAVPVELSYLLAIARHGTFAAAAKALRLDPSKLSNGIRDLEKALGLRLLERKQGRASVIPTNDGQALLEAAQKVVDAAAVFGFLADEIKRGEAGIISVACYPVHIARFVAAVITEFRRTHPRVRVDLSRMLDPLSETTYRTRFEMLKTGRVDLAVGPPQDDEDLDWCELYYCNLVIGAVEGSPFRGRERVSIKELKDHSILIAPEPYPSRMEVAKACKKAGFDLQELVEVESTNPVALLALSRDGSSVPVVPDDHPPIGRTRKPYPFLETEDGAEIGISVALHWKVPDELPEHVLNFIACAKKCASEEKDNPFSMAIDLLSPDVTG